MCDHNNHYLKSICIVIFLLLSPMLISRAQEKVDTAMVQKIKDEGLNHSNIMELSSWLTDVYAPRLNWSPEYRKAAQWAMTKFKELGAENIHIEKFAPMGKGWSLKKFYLNILEPQIFPLIAYPKAWSPGARGTVNAELIYLDAANDSALARYHGKLKNKFVLISEPIKIHPHFQPDAFRQADSTLLVLANRTVNDQPRINRPRNDSTGMQREKLMTAKLEFCRKEGARAIFEANDGDDGTLRYVQGATILQSMQIPADSTFVRRHAYDADAPVILPQITIAAEHYNRLFRMLQKDLTVRAEMNLDVAMTEADSSFNIIAEIRGADLANQVVMIGAHFDTWHAGTGATDNGSGVAVCMEAIRILKALQVHPRRTIRIGLWGGEEEGLLGSIAYVRQHFAERTSNLRNQAATGDDQLIIKSEDSTFSAYFNDDHGGGRVRGMFLEGDEAARSIFRSWFAVYGDPSAQTISAINTGGTDHMAFNEVGLPAFQFIQDQMDYGARTRHSNMDVYDRLVEDDLKQTATMMAMCAYNAAMRDQLFPRKSLR